MRFVTVALIVLFATRADAQQIRLFGDWGSEMHATPANGVSVLNPDNVLRIDAASASSDLTLVGDVTSDEKRWKIQTKLRGSGEWRTGSTSRLEIDELSLNYDVASWLNVRIGRKIERWGTGYAWNPTFRALKSCGAFGSLAIAAARARSTSS